MIKLVYEVPKDHMEFTATKSVVMELQDECTLDEMLQSYGEFLKSVGFNFDGYLTITEDE